MDLDALGEKRFTDKELKAVAGAMSILSEVTEHNGTDKFIRFLEDLLEKTDNAQSNLERLLEFTRAPS